MAQLCATRAGLKVDPEKVYLLESRLGPVARREGFGSIADLVESLRNRGEEKLVWGVIEAMAFRETSFFRDRAPFEAFRDHVLPELARAREGRPIRIWSAACGSGQEVYSLAMMVDEQEETPPGVKVELFASDLSERALEKAQSGLYTQFEVQRGLPIRQLVRHFEKVDDMWAISPRIRQTVRWRRVNLINDLDGVGPFDAIFCRHLLPTLVDAVRPKVLKGLAAALASDGFLVLDEDALPAGADEALQAVPGRAGLYARNPAFRAAA